jgi:hypothetical protein
LNSEKAASSFRTYALMALTVGVIAMVTTAFVLTDASGNNGSASSSTTSSVAGTTTAANPSLGIQLVLSVSPGQGQETPSFEVNATVRNTLSRPNNVTGINDYNGVQVNPLCNTGPVTFEVLQGYYTIANFTAGTVLSIHGVQNMMCIVPTSALSYYVFQPNSDVFSGPLQQEQVGPQNSTAAMTTRSATTADSLVDMYLGGLASPEPFPAGTYTVVAADNWGQLAAVHFTVTG